MCHGTKLTMGDYTISTNMYSMDIAGAHVVLDALWLETLGEFSMNLKELYLEWKGDKEILIKSMKTPPPQVVSSHQM